MELLADFWETLTWTRIALSALALIISVAISYAAIILVMVKIPADYFSPSYNFNHRSERHFLLRWTATILKNLIGALLIVAGVIMIFGPGPGVLTILLGVILLDIPGKRPLEASLIKRPLVLTAINNLRLRYNKPPLILD
ncbi:MAG: PGPGW domain-containing protein, partial [Pyrinomonadaceae bacterium]